MQTRSERIAEESADQWVTASATAVLGQALWVLADALAVVDRDGAILSATAAAERILRGADGADVRLALLNGGGVGCGSSVDIEVPRVSRRPLSLRVQPLAKASEHSLVEMHDPEEGGRVEVSRLASIYGLTPTEALLAAAMAEGGTLASFAAARGCSYQTARTHLKRVLSKTGCTRQVDLVRLTLSNPLLRQRVLAPTFRPRRVGTRHHATSSN